MDMEIDKNDDIIKNLDEIANSLDVLSPAFKESVNYLANTFGIVQHSDPVITLCAIEKRISKIKEMQANANKKMPACQAAEHIIALESLDIGASSSNSPQLDNVIRILRLLHGVKLRELQTDINVLIADVQKVTANPKCDLNLGRIGR